MAHGLRDADSLLGFTLRVVVLHTITYWGAGLVFSALFDYQQLFAVAPMATYMKPFDSIWVTAGIFFQPLRGAIMGAVLWPFRQVFLGRERGWLALWGLFVGVAILNAPGPSPGSIEGVVYSTLPLAQHLRGLPEVLVQTLLFSVLLVHWEHHPGDRRLWWGFGGLFVLFLGLSALGVAVVLGGLQ